MWYVHIWVRGHYSGFREHETWEAARLDADEKTEQLRFCGCFYQVTDSDKEPK